MPLKLWRVGLMYPVRLAAILAAAVAVSSCRAMPQAPELTETSPAELTGQFITYPNSPFEL